MRIGNHELNDDEAAWCRGLAEEISNYATKKAISSLNKKVSQEDVQGILKFIWGNKSQPVAEFETEPRDENTFNEDEDE